MAHGWHDGAAYAEPQWALKPGVEWAADRIRRCTGSWKSSAVAAARRTRRRWSSRSSQALLEAQGT